MPVLFHYTHFLHLTSSYTSGAGQWPIVTDCQLPSVNVEVNMNMCAQSTPPDKQSFSVC